MTTTEAAEKWGVSIWMVHKYLKQRRILRAKKRGRDWFIPDCATKPEPLRKKKDE